MTSVWMRVQIGQPSVDQRRAREAPRQMKDLLDRRRWKTRRIAAKSRLPHPPCGLSRSNSHSSPEFNQRGHCKLLPDLRNSTADIVLICKLRPLCDHLFWQQMSKFYTNQFRFNSAALAYFDFTLFWTSLFIST